MEIEFNTGNVGKPDRGQPAARKEAVPAASEGAAFPRTAEVEQKIRDIPLVRPGRVERAKMLLADVKYPPDEMLVGIANLLAMHIK